MNPLRNWQPVKVLNNLKEVIHMTINLFFITLTLSVSKKKKTKTDIQHDQEIQKRMEEVKTKQFENFHNM